MFSLEITAIPHFLTKANNNNNNNKQIFYIPFDPVYMFYVARLPAL